MSDAPTNQPSASDQPAPEDKQLIPQPQSAPVASQPGSDLPVPSTAGMAADDNDVIEKEWVEKAKQIVDQTKGDPYKQTEAMNLFKADYMKKRYNKIIKVDR